MKEFIDKLISRLEELKKRNTGCYGIACIKCKYDNECHEGEKDYKVVLDESIKIVKQLAEEYNNGWIPCDERSPDKNGRYMVTVQTPKKNYYTASIQYFNDSGWVCILGRGTKIIAWKNEEPYRPKEQ